MFRIETYSRGSREVFDLHALPIAGTVAHMLDGPSLYKLLSKIGCPDINPTDGWQQLAVAYARYRANSKMKGVNP